MSDVPDFLTTAELAEWLRTSPGALYTQRARRELPGALGVRIGKRVLYRRSDVEAWLDGLRAERFADLGAER